jgi:hypothetical protein
MAPRESERRIVRVTAGPSPSLQRKTLRRSPLSPAPSPPGGTTSPLSDPSPENIARRRARYAASGERPYRVAKTWIQIAIIPRNSASEVKAAASSANSRNITTLPLKRTNKEHSSYYVPVKWFFRVGVMRNVGLAMGIAVIVGACAGRAPQPVAVVQPQDRYADCAAITAEIEANNQKVTELASEQGLKIGQNVAAGVAGLVVWPLLFAMDFQDTASKEVAALQSRQQYLATLAQQRCVPAAPPQPAPARKR